MLFFKFDKQKRLNHIHVFTPGFKGSNSFCTLLFFFFLRDLIQI